MLAVSLVFGSFLTILFLVVGLIGGWTAREYMMNYREVPRPHPEMFDGNGNLIPDEVIAFNFENYHDDYEEGDDSEALKQLERKQHQQRFLIFQQILLYLKSLISLQSRDQLQKKLRHFKSFLILV